MQAETDGSDYSNETRTEARYRWCIRDENVPKLSTTRNTHEWVVPKVISSLMTQRCFDCFHRESYTALLYATKVAWASIGDEDDITGLSTRPVILGEGGTIHITNPWFNNVEPKPIRVEVLLFELLMYGFRARGLHNWFEKADMKMDVQT